MFNRKSLLVIALVLVLSLTLVACSSDKGSDNGDTPPAGNDTPDNGGKTSDLRPEGVPEDFPNKEIEYLYGFSAGSVQDAYIRILFDKIQEMEGWKHGFVVTYREGASGKIQWNELANAEPDGYTIGFAPSAMLIPGIAESDEVDFGYDEYDYLFNMMSDPGAIGVAIDSEHETLEDLVEAARANPGKITVGVTSTIGQEGLTMKLLERAADVEFNVVAFNGGADVLAGVVGGHVDAFCLNITDTTTFLENNQIKVLATGNTERSEFLPDVPTYQEAGYDVVQVNMRAVAAPKGLPEPIKEYLENCLLAAAQDPEVLEQIADMQIPLDNMGGDDVKEAFGNIHSGLVELWENDPWQ